MESPQIPTSPVNAYGQMKSSSSSTSRLVDDVTCLTSFNPFSEEDEHDQSSYTLVSSLFSRVKNSFAAPLSAAAGAGASPSPPTIQSNASPNDAKRLVDKTGTAQTPSPVSRQNGEARPRPFKIGSSGPSLAPPLVTVDPAVPEAPSTLR